MPERSDGVMPDTQDAVTASTTDGQTETTAVIVESVTDHDDDEALDRTKLREALRKERDARSAAEKERARLDAIVTKAEADQRKAETAKAKEQGDWERLATEREAELERLKGELTKRDRDALKAAVAAKHRLSPALADRLAGDTEEDLDRDAAALAKLVAAREAPDTEAGAGTKGPTPAGDRPRSKARTDPTYTFDRSAAKVPWPS